MITVYMKNVVYHSDTTNAALVCLTDPVEIHVYGSARFLRMMY